MFDLVSTREGVDAETRGYARILIAGIAQATRDLALVPSEAELRRELNINEDARESLEFFFGKNKEVFQKYADMLGFDAGMYLHNLQHGKAMDVRFPLYTDQDFRAFRTRIRWFKKHQETVAEVTA